MTMQLFRLLTLCGLIFAGPSAQALEVTQAWVRATVPGQTVGAAYMTLTSDVEARVVAVKTPVARQVEMHGSSMKDGVMRMRQLAFVELPRNKTVELAPAGTHLMLMDLTAPLVAGVQVEFELTIQTKGKRRVVKAVAEVRPLAN